MKISHIISEQIDSLINEGNSCCEKGDLQEAINMYNEALEMVPLPKNQYEISERIYSALGDAYFSNSDFDKASKLFYMAFNCPGGIENPFVSLRLGQCMLELNQKQKSREFLLRAYMLDGNEIFEGESLKYYEVIYNDIK